jgi:hypothetical protein
MSELDESFILAGVGTDDGVTRTHWEQDPETKALVNKFLPIYGTAGSSGQRLSEVFEAQAVGLCWLGDGAPGTDVYTNYQFYHFGWLNKNEKNADVDKCGTLYNGALYSEIELKNDVTGGAEAVPATDWGAAGLPGKALKAGEDNLNYNSGVYKTDNKAIFGGQYIVYYPFDQNFENKGAIPAKARTLFSWTPGDTYTSPLLGAATFRYSDPVEIKGGSQAAGFGLKNLSTLVRLRVSTVSGDLAIGENIDQVVLLSESGKFIKQANLAADQIVAGKKGTELYASADSVKTITTNFTANTALNVKATTTVSAYLTVLPTTVDDLKVLVHNATEGKWATVDVGETVFAAGGAQVIDVTVKAADFQTEFFAVDAASLQQALLDAEAVATEADPVTIRVIGDITLTGDLNINNVKDQYITIAGGDIIVPELVTLTLTTLKEMKSTVRVLGTDCCSGALTGGRLVVTGLGADDATILNNITLEPTEARVTADNYDNINPQVTYEGDAKITIAEGATVNVKAGNVNVNRAVEHKGAIVIGANKDKDDVLLGAKVTVNATGELSFLGSDVDNYGIIEVKKAGQFYMKNANGTSVWSDGEKMTNHATGKFIHNVDAVVGTAVQFMNQETGSEYRCRVDKQKALDDAYVQWTACSVIEMVEVSDYTYDLAQACQHTIWGAAKWIDVEVNNTGHTTTFKDKKSVNVGNLTVLTPLVVDDNAAKLTLTVNGNMTVSANTQLKKSDKITVTGNLDIDNAATLTYAGENAIVNGLEVKGDITVTDATFDAYADGGILISCTNFSLIKETGAGATAKFGNRTAGDTTKKTMEVKGTINNGKGCTFTIKPAAGGNLLAWITCYKTEGEGTYAGTPTVVKP